MLLHGGNILCQVHHVPKLFAAAIETGTYDDGSVRSAKERRKTLTSARARALGVTVFTFLHLPIDRPSPLHIFLLPSLSYYLLRQRTNRMFSMQTCVSQKE